MRIGLFTDCYHPTKNGVTTSLAQLREGLLPRGHHVVVFTVATPGYTERDPTVHRFPSFPFNREIEIRVGLTNQRAINQLVREERLDLLHSHTEFSLGWAAKRAARALRLPLVHTLHTLYPNYRHYLPLGNLIPKSAVQCWLAFFLRGTTTVCPSAKMQAYLRDFLPRLQTVVIPNGVSTTRFDLRTLTDADIAATRAALGLAPTDTVGLYVGRLSEEKRVLALLTALTPLLQQQPQLKALFVGRGPAYAALEQQAAQARLSAQVLLPGYMPWEQMRALYAVGSVFVTASLSEVHPMTVIEAAMCGLPIIARRDLAYADLVQDGYNGYQVDTDDQLAARLAGLLADDARRAAFAHHSRTLATQFSSAAHVERLEHLYASYIGSGSDANGTRHNPAPG